MKKTLMALMLGLLCFGAVAQPGQKKQEPPTHVPPAARYTVNFESQHGESFSVFMDGNLVNRLPQSRVMLNDVSDQNHRVVVVLKRPAEKAAVLDLRPGEPNVTVNVNYDQRLEELMLYTPTVNRAEAYDEEWVRQREEYRRRHEQLPPSIATIDERGKKEPFATQVTVATEDELKAMMERMQSQPFDADRLALGKVIVASANLNAVQIGRLASTIDYSNSQVEFLKYAYHYCVDQKSYYEAIDILTFSNDKKKVLDYIATQQ